MFLILPLLLVACSQTKQPSLAPSATESSARSTPEYAPEKSGEIRSVEIHGETFTYRVVDGLVVIEGDMILGPVEEVEAQIVQARNRSLSTQSFGATDFLGNYKFWPDGKVYYTFDDNSLLSSKRVLINKAIEHWEDATMLRFYARSTGPRIIFRTVDSSCSSNVGYPGPNGIANTNIGGGCGLPEIIHEIGHAVALNHEHTRCDRDNFVGIYSGRVENGQEYNFSRNLGC